MTSPVRGAQAPDERRANDGIPGGRFLDPAVLARIDDLEYVARMVVEGFLNGLHRSPHLGYSTDFAEHRAYMPGDDIRHIDWRLYARTERLYLKEYEAETNTNFMVMLDVSRSMRYGSGALTKLDYARVLAACLTYFSNRQRDRVGFSSFDRDIVDYVPCSAKHLLNCLHAIDRAEPREPGALARPLARIAESMRRRSMIVVISDLYENPLAVRDAVAPLRDAGHDLVLMHVLDPAELAFPFEEAATFEDSESGERIPVVPSRLRTDYKKLVSDHIAALEKILGESRIDYAFFDTSRPIDAALFEYLVRRERLGSVR